MLIQSLNCNSTHTFGFVSLLSLINFYFCSLNATMSVGTSMLQLRARGTRELQKAPLPCDDRIYWSPSQLTLRLEPLVTKRTEWPENSHTEHIRWRWLPMALQIRGRICFPKHQLPLNITYIFPTPYLSYAHQFPYHHLDPASSLWTPSLAWWSSCLPPALPNPPFPSQSLTSPPVPPQESPPWLRTSHCQHPE